MEGQNRARASSAGQISNVHLSHSPSSQQFPGHTSRLDLNLPLHPSNFATAGFDTGVISSSPTTEVQYNFIDHHVVPSNGFNDQSLDQPMQSNGIATDPQRRPLALSIQHSPHQFGEDLLGSSTTSNFDDFAQQHPTSKPAQQFDSGFLIDPEYHTGMQPQHTSINPADIMNLSSPHNMIPSPPTLMPPEARSSRQGSPAPPQGQYYSPNHSRHTSLDPSSAIFAHNPHQMDWSGMLQFQGHRRAPSEHSDVSSSVAPSPFLAQTETFELDYNPSPLMNPVQDNPLYPGLGMEQISLSDPQQEQHQHQHQPRMSPGHSPYDSPRISPHMGLGIPRENFMLPTDLGGSFSGGPGPDIYPNQTDSFSQFNPRHDSSDMGQAAQMTPPEINVEFAPTTKQLPFEPSRTDNDQDALSPPARG